MQSDEKSHRNENIYRESILKAGKEIYHANLVDFGEGNISIKVPDKKEIYITPTLNDYATFIPEDIVHLDWNGHLIESKRAPSSEYRLHLAVYNAHPNAHCVIHTHSPYACMLGAVHQKIPIILEEMLLFLGGEIEVSSFTPAGTTEIGENAVQVMGTRNGVLMEDHGALVCGRTVADAVKNAKLVEKTAFIYWGAAQLGTVQSVPEKFWAKFLKKFQNSFSTY